MNTYKSINDAPNLPSGNTKIWYWKEDLSRDMLFGDGKKLFDRDNPGKTHVLIGSVGLTDLEEIFCKLQGENWSPNGEARNWIRESGTGHTSMSVGDIIELDGKFLMCDRFNWTEL